MAYKRMTQPQRLIYTHLIYHKKLRPNEPCHLPPAEKYSNRSDRIEHFLNQLNVLEDREFITVDRNSDNWRTWTIDFGVNRTLLTEHQSLHEQAI